MEKKFACGVCNYLTDIKCNFEKHNTTAKHISNVNNAYENGTEKKLICSYCQRRFGHRGSLWRHKKRCILNLNEDIEEETIKEETIKKYVKKEFKEETIKEDVKKEFKEETIKEDVKKEFKEETIKEDVKKEFKEETIKGLNEIIITLVKENNKFKDAMLIQQQQQQQEQLETNKMLLEIVKNNNNPIINNTNNSNNTTNNNFNLNVFLNETCKDAMTIDEFMDSIEITIPDLKRLGKYGYVEALSNLLISNLNNLEYTKRPMHCSDVKREIIYIKDKHKWEKESERRENLIKILCQLTRMNTIALQDIYQTQYPDCLTNHNSKEHKEYGEIVYNAFGGKGDTEQLNKYIIRKLIKEIKINKL
jgi:hypothetical protein